MTFTQLEYVVSLATHRHFALAAESCHVTQPTLSMQINKLEQQLNIQLFDRSKQPILPTEAGAAFIEKARAILHQRDALLEDVAQSKGLVSGTLKLGIIPTLAPYLLPLFVGRFSKNYPGVHLTVVELTTRQLVSQLKEAKIDAGIVVTPLKEQGIREDVLFYEELIAYVSREHQLFKKLHVQPRDMDPGKLWLLEEGHCFRSQIVNLCELRAQNREASSFIYEAGSLETLKKMVDVNEGMTILPELATLDMSAKQQQQLRTFRHPAPVREVSLVVHRHFVKKKMIDALKKDVLDVIPPKIAANKKVRIVPIDTHDIK